MALKVTIAHVRDTDKAVVMIYETQELKKLVREVCGKDKAKAKLVCDVMDQVNAEMNSRKVRVVP